MSEDKTEEIAEDVKSDNLTETDGPGVNNHSIKLNELLVNLSELFIHFKNSLIN